MKTNNECIREILKKIEKISYKDVITVDSLVEMIKEFSKEDVIATVNLLNREHFIIIADKAGYDDSDVFSENKIKCLTDKGYRNLDLIREDRIWNLMKEKLPNFNDLSYFTIATIAGKIMHDEYNKIFDIKSNPSVDYSRW